MDRGNHYYVCRRSYLGLEAVGVALVLFFSHPFQNWTRESANLMGVVHIYADYSVPVDEVRSELARVMKTLPDWDGKVCVLQVTHATDHAVELRALVSASDSGKLWNLRCAVRERLIAFIQKQYPHCLPKMRAEAAMTRADGFNGIGRDGVHES